MVRTQEENSRKERVLVEEEDCKLAAQNAARKGRVWGRELRETLLHVLGKSVMESKSLSRV